MSSSVLQFSLSKRFVLDANVLLAAWHDHYPIDIYPGFWDCLERFWQEKTVLSVDRVRDEIKGPNELLAWLRRNWRGAFASTESPGIAKSFAEMQTWVQGNAQFLPAAKHEFARAADGWLAAYAKTNNAILVTNEVRNDDAKKRVPLPNLSMQFNVECCNTIDLLRRLGVTFDVRTPQ